MRVASRCGVTRLADITHLDVLGVPAFQAFRPWGRGLSVHQGKGLTEAQAAIGALMEAIELQHAEDFTGEPIVCAFNDLPPGEQALTVSDFADDRAASPSAEDPLAWVAARTWRGGVLWVPFDVVSLDLSRLGDERLARSSDGLACRFDAEEAFATGLLELLERDAVASFLAAGPIDRMLARIDVGSAPFEWLASLRKRLREAEISIAVYRAPALVAVAFVCELLEPSAASALRGAVWGSGCHPCAETALQRAVLEAVQSRLTAISGARDDLLPEHDAGRRVGLGFALPPSASLASITWSALTDGLDGWAPSVPAIASRLASAGYPNCARVSLSPPGAEVAVIKAFAPGLGSGARRRRRVALS